jgi:hypothetical protein
VARRPLELERAVTDPTSGAGASFAQVGDRRGVEAQLGQQGIGVLADQGSG